MTAARVTGGGGDAGGVDVRPRGANTRRVYGCDTTLGVSWIAQTKWLATLIVIIAWRSL